MGKRLRQCGYESLTAASASDWRRLIEALTVFVEFSPIILIKLHYGKGRIQCFQSLINN